MAAKRETIPTQFFFSESLSHKHPIATTTAMEMI